MLRTVLEQLTIHGVATDHISVANLIRDSKIVPACVTSEPSEKRNFLQISVPEQIAMLSDTSEKQVHRTS